MTTSLFLLLTLFACPAPTTQETGAPPPSAAPASDASEATAPEGA